MKKQLAYYRFGRLAVLTCTAALAMFVLGCPGTVGGGRGGVNPNPPQPLDSDADGVNNDLDECANTAAGLNVDDVGCPISAPGTPDTDDDGVNDDIDQCADTAAGAEVNANGCPDTDGDGIFDDIDECANTLPAVQIDAVGCPVSAPGTPDSDGDEVPNDIDQCADTPAGEAVDPNGCSAGQRDDDGDNVTDDIDQCADTPAGEAVDPNGCSVGQRDDDGDNVTNDIDQCADTPAGETADANGCSAGQRDDDGDNVTDDIDQCLQTPTGEEVDATGCAASERDTDDDGVNDDVDQCPDTPVRTDVDATGCPTTSPPPPPPPPPGCGDGEVGDGEDCDDGEASATCDADCTFAECGDGTLNGAAGEECDDGNTTGGDGCAADCLLEGDNDFCTNPAPVTDGTIDFSNEGATTDTFTETGVCADFVDLVSDIWFCYEATCTDTATISLCGSSYDTTVSVYPGCDCPENIAALKCNDDGCGVSVDFRSSRVTFPATAGNSYMIRIAGYNNANPANWDAEGTGKLTIFCGSDSGHGADACGSGSPDCFTADNSPGCVDQDCCSDVCGFDPYCCDAEWDSICTEEAVGVCGDGYATCGPGAGDCFTGDDNRPPGCEATNCCQTVCEQDPVCCVSLGLWDQFCADEAAELCGAADVCAEATGNCFAAHTDPGCNDLDCCEFVCLEDPYCCQTEWDETCADLAVACRG